MQSKLLTDIKQIPLVFWLLNILQMLEKLAYWCVLLQMPIYIAQKDVPGGLHWEQMSKGVIFFWWALVQNIVPIFSGGFADRYGRKKIMMIALVFVAIGYLVLGTQKDFYIFIAGTIILGFGSGLFKPSLQGAVAQTLVKKNSSVGWGIYFMLLNLAVFFGPPLSKYLKEISWTAVFIGSMVIILLNFLVIIFVKEVHNPWLRHSERSEESGNEKSGFFTSLRSVQNDNSSNADEPSLRHSERSEESIGPVFIIKRTIQNILKPQLLIFVILMTGFTIIYMQFYETLPNFIYDWTDSSHIATDLHLPAFMLTVTSRGTMISYEWLYNLNAGLIIIAVVFVSWLFAKKQALKVLSLGIIVSVLGLFLCGLSYSGYFMMSGILLYTFGEMTTNPKFADYMGSLAPEGEKSLYMSYLNIPLALGLGGGSLLGGYLYKHFAEKANLALLYLNEHFHSVQNASLTNSMSIMQKVTALDSASATQLLWNTYQPYKIWFPFLVIGIISAMGLVIYNKYKK